MSKLAESETAITAITPHWTGSLTTRSAAAGTVPGMFSESTIMPDLAHREGDLPAHEGAGKDQRHSPREAGHGPCGRGELSLTDQGDGVHGDLLSADVVPVGLRDRADHHLPDLRSPTDHDDALAVNLLERGRPLDHPHDG
jgi:hypothetical protein